MTVKRGRYSYSDDSYSRLVQGANKSAKKAQQRGELLRKAYEADKKQCLECGEYMPYKKRHHKFCSKSCSATFNNRKRESRAQKRACLFCKTLTSNSKFCCTSCQHRYRDKVNWETALSSGSLNHNPQTQRRLLKKFCGFSCEICNLDEWMGQKAPLVLDHIDGNSDNNELTNLRFVCANCDMQLPTYKARNKGKGRHYRRQRYAKGQSY